MESRKDIKRAYLEREKPVGVFQIKNTANGKIYLGSSLNLEGILNGQKFRLTHGSHRNPALQQEWKEYGADAFVFEILEEVKRLDDEHFNLEDELTLLEEIWLEKMQPYGDRGYIKQGASIRHV